MKAHTGRKLHIYSISGNAGICSSCAEFFNIISDDSRKLVSSCPGAVVFGGAQRDVYYDIQPVTTGKPNNTSPSSRT
jgi:hypothetical protein